MVGASFPIEERREGEEALPRIPAMGENKWGSGVGWGSDEWVLSEAGASNPGGVTRCYREGCVITEVGPPWEG